MAKVFTGCNKFSRPIPIKGHLWYIPIKQFKWQYPYAVIGEHKLHIVYYR